MSESPLVKQGPGFAYAVGTRVRVVSCDRAFVDAPGTITAMEDIVITDADGTEVERWEGSDIAITMDNGVIIHGWECWWTLAEAATDE